MRFDRFRPTAVALVCALAALPAVAQSRTALPNHTPKVLSRATDLGAVQSNRVVPLTIWLKLHNGSALDDTLKAQNAGAPFISGAQLRAAHAPSDAEVATVSGFLRSQGLKVTGAGPHNFYVTASGTAAQVQSAFQTELHQFSLGNSTFHANVSNPSLPSHVAPLVVSVGGLNTHGAKPMNVRPVDPDGVPFEAVPLAPTPDGKFFEGQCFRPPEVHTFTGKGATATYAGHRYGADISNKTLGHLAPCGYKPSEMWTAYHLNPLYQAGFDGTGTTVAIVDAFGSTTIQHDIDTFSKVYHLPPADLTVLGTSTESPFSGDANSGWAIETTLDVEWVHAIAPGAKILLVVAVDNSFANLFAAIAQAEAQDGVVAISNSWAGLESFTDPPTRDFADAVLKAGNAQGIAVNFSSGDSGNETINLGYADVDYPSSSPFATSIGGVSVALRADRHIAFQTSWGNNLTFIAGRDSQGNPPFDPPLNAGFQFGGGGGESNIYPKPSFQHELRGARRMVPDISWLADPYTGAEFIYSVDAAGDQVVSVVGGTSLSCPMFSALWGIASQRAGHNLGQAAQYVYDLPEEAITDVVPFDTNANVAGTLTDAFGTQTLTVGDLSLPMQGNQDFFSAFYHSPRSTRWFVNTFGVDSTLQTKEGWDEATGVGTPVGAEFVEAVASRRHHGD